MPRNEAQDIATKIEGETDKVTGFPKGNADPTGDVNQAAAHNLLDAVADKLEKDGYIPASAVVRGWKENVTPEALGEPDEDDGLMQALAAIFSDDEGDLDGE